MPLTAEQMRQAVGALRLQQDQAFQNILNHIIETATEEAIYLPDHTQRETARQTVLAVNRLRIELQADAEAPAEVAAAEALAKSME